jgi:hypothetical protein
MKHKARSSLEKQPFKITGSQGRYIPVNVEAQYQGGSTRRKAYILARSATL